MKIINLKQKPEYLEELAIWHQQEWSNLNPGQTLQDRILKMQAYLNNEFIPTTYVAVENQLMGSAAIIECDMEDRKELSPWLASVYVAPEFRRQGVGEKLVKEVMQQAREHGFKKLFLYTPDQELFYKKNRWEIIEQVAYHGQNVTIMSADLNV